MLFFILVYAQQSDYENIKTSYNSHRKPSFLLKTKLRKLIKRLEKPQNYSNSSNDKNTNTDRSTTFKISTRSIVSSTNESKPGPSVKLLGGFDFYL